MVLVICSSQIEFRLTALYLEVIHTLLIAVIYLLSNSRSIAGTYLGLNVRLIQLETTFLQLKTDLEKAQVDQHQEGEIRPETRDSPPEEAEALTEPLPTPPEAETEGKNLRKGP